MEYCPHPPLGQYSIGADTEKLGRGRARSAIGSERGKHDLTLLVKPAQRYEHLRPIQIELAMRGRTISQIQIYETLVWDTSVLRNRLEITY
jgi:hypothetical protein